MKRNLPLQIQNFLINLVNFFYKRIFHEEISDEVRSFMRDLTHVGLGVAIAIPFSFAFIILAGVLYYIFSPRLSGLFSIPQELFYLSIIFIVLHVLHVLTEGTLRGLGKMKAIGVFKPVYTAVLFTGRGGS